MVSRLVYILVIISFYGCKIINSDENIEKLKISINPDELNNPEKIFVDDSIMLLVDNFKGFNLSIFNLKTSKLIGRYFPINKYKVMFQLRKIDSLTYIFTCEDYHYTFNIANLINDKKNNINTYSNLKSIELFSPIFLGDSLCLSLGMFNNGQFYYRYYNNIFFHDNYPIDSSINKLYHTNSTKFSVYQGILERNYMNNYFLYFSRYGYFKILKFNSGKIQTIKEHLPKTLPEYRFIEKNSSVGIGDISNKIFFIGCNLSDSKIWFLNLSGKTYKQVGLNINYSNRLDLYNWDGELIKIIELDQHIKSFSVSNDYIYCISKNQITYKVEILKYKLI